MFQHLRQYFIEDVHRFKLWLPVFLGVGIVFYFQANFKMSLLWPFLCIFLSLLCLYVFRKKSWGYFMFILAFCFSLGFFLAQLRTQWMDSPRILQEHKLAFLEGEIQAFETTSKGFKSLLSNLHIDGFEKDQTPIYLRFSGRDKETSFRPGDRIQAKVILKPPLGAAFPGAYDFGRVAYFNQIGGVAFAIGKIYLVERPSVTSFGHRIESIRQSITERLRLILPDQRGEIATALITGQKLGIKEEVYGYFRDSGLAHLLAISGLHFGLIFGFIYSFFRFWFALIPRLPLRVPIKQWSICLGLFGAFLYSMIAGGSIPTIRAFIMLGIFTLAVLVNRKALSLNNIAIAGGLILIFVPEVILGPSFQMSFAAVIGLIAFYEIVSKTELMRVDSTLKKIFVYIVGLCLSSLIATLATAPFTVLHFGQFQTYGIAANLVAIPITGIWIMPLALLSLALMPFGLDQFPLLLMGHGIDIVIEVARYVASWNGAVIHTAMLGSIGIAIIVSGGLWFAIWEKNWRYWGLFPFFLGFLSLYFVQTPDVMIADNMKLIGWKEGDCLYLSSLKRQEFTAQQFQAVSATKHRVCFPYSKNLKSLLNTRYSLKKEGIQCDPEGCVIQTKGKIIAIPRKEKALELDCKQADIVLIGFKTEQKCFEKNVVTKDETPYLMYIKNTQNKKNHFG